MKRVKKRLDKKMSETLHFENVFKSDSEKLQKYIEKKDMIKSFKNQEGKTNKTLERSVGIMIAGITLSTPGVLLTLGMLFSPNMNTSNLFNFVFATVTVLVVLLTIVFAIKSSKSNDKLVSIAEEISKIKKSIKEDVAKKVRQDLKNLYNAKMSEDSRYINVFSSGPKNEIVFENGDTVLAVLKYDENGLMKMKVFSTIKEIEPNADYVSPKKKDYNVIDDLVNVDAI